MDDAAFVNAFFDSVGDRGFHHRDHLRLAWLSVRHGGQPEQLVGEAIRTYATAHGAAAKYHETLTVFWVRLVAHAVRTRPDIDDFDEFLAAFPLLLEPRLAERHWSEAAIWSEEARAEFVDPDLRLLPA